MITSRKSKSIGLFSGGLDSLLATKLVTEQGVQAVALHFRLPFLSPARPSKEEKLRSLAELVGASFVSVDVGEDYLKAVKTPQHGYARNMAPCIDCIVYLLAKAKELAREIDADFLFTGEVVGQRSHCQNKRSLKLIEKVAGVDGRLLRPLSAKLLEPTVPELTGLLRRERLLDIKGRGRRRQIRLAHEFGIRVFHHDDGSMRSFLSDLVEMEIGDQVKHSVAGQFTAVVQAELERATLHLPPKNPGGAACRPPRRGS